MLYLAMTAAELGDCIAPPPKIAWMACHFSPYSTGLTNLPKHLPPDSLLILNDRTPIHGHDPGRIRDTVAATVEAHHCRGLLLDLQQEHSGEMAALVRALASLPCPVAAPAPYAEDVPAVFLPPVPLWTPLAEYLAPWDGRPIWLDIAPEAAQVTVTNAGATTCARSRQALPKLPHRDEELCLHYGIERFADRAQFTLCRTRADLEELLHRAETHGVTTAVGLYQEWFAEEKHPP